MPSIKSDEILVKVHAATLCHSDLMLFEAGKGGPVVGNDPITMVSRASNAGHTQAECRSIGPRGIWNGS